MIVWRTVVRAFSAFRRAPVITAIKVLALALGLTCFLSAHLVSDYFRNLDGHWARADRIAVVMQSFTRAGEPQSQSRGGAAAPLAGHLRAEAPELEAVARALTTAAPYSVDGQSRQRAFNGVDPEFLRIFDLRPVAGDVATGLDAPNTAVIRASAAQQMFGLDDPAEAVGRSFTLLPDIDLTVTGVFEDLPAGSHLTVRWSGAPLDVVVSIGTLDAWFAAMLPPDAPPYSERQAWTAADFVTYALLPEDGAMTRAELDRRLAQIAGTRVPPEQGEAAFEAVSLPVYGERLFNRMALAGSLGVPLTAVLTLFGVLALALACVNFANIATAEAAERGKEIGIRRTVGARRRQIAAQVLGESAVLIALALALALPLTLIAMGPLRAAFLLDSFYLALAHPSYWVSVLAVLAATLAAAAAYPALILGGVPPIRAVRRAIGPGRRTVRAALTGAQFAATAFLIAIVVVMLMQKAELRGAARVEDDVLITLAIQGGDRPDRLAALRADLRDHPLIRGVAAGPRPFTRLSGAVRDLSRPDDPGAAAVPAQIRTVSEDYFHVAGVALLSGRGFDDARDAPGGAETALIIDAATAARFGWTPDQAVGRTLTARIPHPDLAVEPETRRIVGVVENAPLEYVTFGPANYIYTPGVGGVPLIRISGSDIPAATAALEQAARRIDPQSAPQVSFVEDIFDGSFRMFTMLNLTAMALAGVAVAIAAMGLFGMAVFTVGRRLPEAGIRKVLGATGGQVFGLMLWDFARLVIVANIVAWPLVYLASQEYLGMFVRRAPITPLPYLAGLCACLVVAFLAVAAQTGRAARVRPASILKAE